MDSDREERTIAVAGRMLRDLTQCGKGASKHVRVYRDALHTVLCLKERYDGEGGPPQPLHADEHYDGTGPLGLWGEQIPLEGRILAVADAFVELTLKKFPTLSSAQALAELEWRAGADFDPKVVRGVKRIFAEEGTTEIGAWASALCKERRRADPEALTRSGTTHV